MKSRYFQLTREESRCSRLDLRKNLEAEWDIHLPTWDPDVHDEQLQRLLSGLPAFDDQQATASAVCKGMSWVHLNENAGVKLEDHVSLFSV